MPIHARRALALALPLILAPLTTAQSPTSPVGAKGAGESDASPVDLSKLPPPVVLGLRVDAVRRKIGAVDRVVIVDSREAFVDALSRWTIESRWPILLDDGSVAARENVARFVRAFRPAQVLRWGGEKTVWPQAVEAQRTLMGDAVASAWGAPSYADLPSTWGELRFIPPGVVLLSESDPLCLSGLALAAGRGQIPLWLTRDDETALPAETSGELTEQQAATLRATLEERLDALGLPWSAAGDAIDAITLAITIPGRISSPAGQRERTNPILALTDYLGRSAQGERYAWTGMLTGDEQQAVYSAMCALFLRPERAWLFDGYKPGGAFDAFDVAAARQPLLDLNIEPVVDDAPFSGTEHWRRRLITGVTAGFIHVNSAGLRRNFNLNPGVATGADVPILNTPAIVHFIHSFSAEDVGDRRSLANRFLNNGAYAYVGSVDEPFLTAFQTPEALVRRMGALAPLAAAARHDTAPTWKINVYGDPLVTLGPPADRTPPETAPELPGAVDLESVMRDALRAGDFSAASAALLTLGRDADLARLYNAVRAKPDESVTSQLAENAFSALFRTSDRDAMLHAARLIPAKRFHNTALQDMLWHAFGPTLSLAKPTPELAAALRDNLRTWNMLDDAEIAAQATSIAEGKEMTHAFLDRLIASSKNDRVKVRLNDLKHSY